MTAEVYAFTRPTSWQEFQRLLTGCDSCVDRDASTVVLEGSRLVSLHAHNVPDGAEMVEVAAVELSADAMTALASLSWIRFRFGPDRDVSRWELAVLATTLLAYEGGLRRGAPRFEVRR